MSDVLNPELLSPVDPNPAPAPLPVEPPKPAPVPAPVEPALSLSEIVTELRTLEQELVAILGSDYQAVIEYLRDRLTGILPKA